MILLSAGCSQSNESKVLGTWMAKTSNDIDQKEMLIYYKFFENGIVSIRTRSVDKENESRPRIKMIGKYKFEKDNENITFHWDDGHSETMKFVFPETNKMILGKYEMEKTDR